MKVAPLVMLEPEQEEKMTPSVIDPVMLGIIHQRVIQQQAAPGDLSVATIEREPISEHGED